MITRERKEIPFRYDPGELGEDLKEVLRIQSSTSKVNRALVHAVQIAAAYMRMREKAKPKKKKGDDDWYDQGPRYDIEEELGISLAR